MDVSSLSLPPVLQAGEGDVGGVLRLALEDVDGVGGFGGPESASLAGGTLTARTDQFYNYLRLSAQWYRVSVHSSRFKDICSGL